MNRRFEVNGDSIGDNEVVHVESVVKKPETGEETSKQDSQRKPFPGFNGVSD